MASEMMCERYSNATIDMDDGTVTEFHENSVNTYNIYEILNRWAGVSNITLTIERQTSLPPLEER